MQRDIDRIIEQLNSDIPGVHIAQLKVAYPGRDDDGLWFVDIPGRQETVQVESSNGSCPFLIESDFSAERFRALSVEEAIWTVKRLYSLI